MCNEKKLEVPNSPLGYTEIKRGSGTLVINGCPVYSDFKTVSFIYRCKIDSERHMFVWANEKGYLIRFVRLLGHRRVGITTLALSGEAVEVMLHAILIVQDKNIGPKFQYLTFNQINTNTLP